MVNNIGHCAFCRPQPFRLSNLTGLIVGSIKHTLYNIICIYLLYLKTNTEYLYVSISNAVECTA